MISTIPEDLKQELEKYHRKMQSLLVSGHVIFTLNQIKNGLEEIYKAYSTKGNENVEEVLRAVNDLICKDIQSALKQNDKDVILDEILYDTVPSMRCFILYELNTVGTDKQELYLTLRDKLLNNEALTNGEKSLFIDDTIDKWDKERESLFGKILLFSRSLERIPVVYEFKEKVADSLEIEKEKMEEFKNIDRILENGYTDEELVLLSQAEFAGSINDEFSWETGKKDFERLQKEGKNVTFGICGVYFNTKVDTPRSCDYKMLVTFSDEKHPLIEQLPDISPEAVKAEMKNRGVKPGEAGE